MQVKIVMCSFLHNFFIRVDQGCEDGYDVIKEEDGKIFYPCYFDVDDNNDNTATAWRDGVAYRMGLHYINKFIVLLCSS